MGFIQTINQLFDLVSHIKEIRDSEAQQELPRK